MRTQHRGVALITALLIVAAAGIMSASIVYWHLASLSRTSNLLAVAQLREYQHGLDQWAISILRRDARETSYDHSGEPWSAPIPPIVIPEGQLGGRLSDLNGRFNINALIRTDGQVDEVMLARLRRLLATLNLNPLLADAIADWVDEDSTPRRDGAEDNVYLRRTPAYRAANQAMRHISELRSVAGVNDAVFAQLAPFVAALPQGTSINVNTAPNEVLMSLDDAFSRSLAESLGENGRRSFSNLDEFTEHPGVLLLALTPDKLAGLSTQSQFFLAEAVVDINGVVARFETIYRRQGLTVTRMWSWPAPIQMPPLDDPAATGYASRQ